MKLTYPRVKVALTVAALAVAAWGCAGNDAASYIQSAKSYIAKADYKAAIIELKNAVQISPENAEARYLLGKALLESGDPSGAETELRKAIAQHADDDLTFPLLAQALIGQGELGKAVKELGKMQLKTPLARADLAVTLAAASYGQGNAQAGAEFLASAISEQPTNPRVLLMQAQVAGQRGDLAAARTYIESALRSKPDDANLLIFKSQVDLAENKRDAAQQALEHAVEKNPESTAARFALLSLAVTSGKVDIAKAQLDKMRQASPRDLRTVYADALVAFVTQDYARSRDAAQSVLGVTPQHVPSLLLTGLTNLKLGAYAPAEDALRKVVTRAPENQLAMRALASIYLRTSRPQQAIETVTPALRLTPDDPALLRMLGEGYLATGDTTRAAAMYERANALDKGNVGAEVRLAQVRMAAGESARAINDLESLSLESKDPQQNQADLALFTALVRRGEFDKALETADRLETKMPKSALPSNLRGITYLAKRDLKSARASFEKALQIEPEFYSAAYNLAVIDLQEGKPEAARDRYERILKKNPKNEQVILALTELVAVTGGSPAEISALLDKAVAANPTSVRARLALISYYIRQRDFKSALAAAQSALSAIPNDPQLIEALGTAQIANGDGNQAVETFKRLALALPQNPLVQLRLADAYAAVKEYPAAIDSVKRALALKPDLDKAWGALARAYIISGHPEGAIAEAKKLQAEQPTKAIGYAIEGEVLAAQNKRSEAVTAFRSGLAKQPSPILAARLYAALISAGKPDEAAAMAAKWVKDNPKDVTMRQLIAEESQRRGDMTAAAAGYRQVLEINPDNPVALNNLAWLLTRNNDPAALEYAERAHRLAPFNPSVLDTLGFVLNKRGDSKRAVQVLQMASALAPSSGEIRLHLAQALVASGNKVQARQQLNELVKLDKASPIRGEAEKLLATL